MLSLQLEKYAGQNEHAANWQHVIFQRRTSEGNPLALYKLRSSCTCADLWLGGHACCVISALRDKNPETLLDQLRRTHPTVHLAEANDDLVGFFNSVPRQQILDSLSRLVALYQAREFPPRVTVSLRKLSNSESAWPNFPTVSLRGQGSPGLEVLSTSNTCMLLMFRQHRGTCVGNQISPVLSSLPVTQRESCWQREWTQFLSSAKYFDTQQAELFVCRYVDNRLLLTDFSILEHQCLKDFQHLHFTGALSSLKRSPTTNFWASGLT